MEQLSEVELVYEYLKYVLPLLISNYGSVEPEDPDLYPRVGRGYESTPSLRSSML